MIRSKFRREIKDWIFLVLSLLLGTRISDLATLASCNPFKRKRKKNIFKFGIVCPTASSIS